MAHGRCVQALRANCALPPRVGVAENPCVCVPVIETPEHIEAAQKAFRIKNARFITALMEGRYLPEFLEEEGADAPSFSDADMRLIGEPLDFVGLNVYAPDYIRADPSAKHGFTSVPLPKSYPRMVPEWLFVGPSITYWGPRFVRELWGVESIYITENGCACDDRQEPDGEVWDTDRVMYLRQHFIAASRAVQEGIPLKGYFVWSLMDNFEWQKGYTERFGIVYVNYQTLKRTPKLSAKFYRETIARNTVV
jgi:beta-glucosidase